MHLDTRWVDLQVEGAPAKAYFARPTRAEGPLPGVVLIQEAFGVDAFVRDVAERLATAGYAVIAPALFSVGGTPEALSEPRIEAAKRFLDGLPMSAWFDPALRAPAIAALKAAEAEHMSETLGLLLVRDRPWDRYLATLKAGRAWLSAEGSNGKKLGALGFCMGGALSLRLACVDPEIAAAVVFYGFAPPPEMLATLQAPVLGLYAENDPAITPGIPALAEAFKAQGKSFQSQVFPGTRHAFFNDTRGSFQLEASRLAWARALSFLAEKL